MKMVAAASLPASPFLAPPFTKKNPLIKPFPIKKTPTKPRFTIRCSSEKEDHGGYGEGRLVDQGMMVLRMRIQKLKAAETNYYKPPPESESTDLETKFFASYCSIIEGAVEPLYTLFTGNMLSKTLGFIILLGICLLTGLVMLFVKLVGVGDKIIHDH